ncbi:phage infection protein [Bradyrhizobium tunisiense]|uniref:phage infection protein n=1 Tax=Bradyrhizobium tunisiense TaxID=3278709 RepID=UPI0035DD0898
MKKLKVELQHCYGIKSLKEQFDFASANACAVYAPNGAMKSSLAKTFQDIADGKESGDRVFPERPTSRKVLDETGAAIAPECILVVRPYDEVFGHTERTSTLLVNAALREEYERLHLEIDAAKDRLLTALKVQSGTKKDIAKEISLAFTRDDQQFYRALIRIRDELASQKGHPFADVNYDIIFDEKVLALLNTKDVRSAIETYIKKYNELLAASTYFKRGVFNYYNASTIAKSLADNGFFKAKHSLRLNADKAIEIADEKELEKLIKDEKEQISTDKELRKKLSDLEKLIQRNATVREFDEYVSNNEHLLPELANIDKFREEVWKSYLKANWDAYVEVVDKFQAAEKRRAEIEAQAAAERTQWEEVIDVFNSRFFVPFKLEAKNRIPVMLGQEPMLSLGFRFEDGKDIAMVDRNNLVEVLSTGEKKALYVLNVIFEIEARRKSGQKTLLVVDDIADSFDYKNKYAIIQYLMEIAEGAIFTQLILTHNFDFFRTINSRALVPYSQCYMASKGEAGLQLARASGIQNVFVNDWKKEFFKDPMKRIASIPFMRNLIEYTKGDTDPDYLRLTSLLHCKADTALITEADLDKIYNGLFGGAGAWKSPGDKVMDTIEAQAAACMKDGSTHKLEGKIVLSLAARFAVESFMVKKIADPAKVAAINALQTTRLLSLYQGCPNCDDSAVRVVKRVVLMTPENIHLNSFMYEPILDMSDDHLRALYQDVSKLS